MEKRKNGGIIIFLIVCIFVALAAGLFGGYKYYELKNNDDNNEESNSNNDDLHENKEDDVYGYAQWSYDFNDGSGKSIYKIVELHKNSEDKVLVSYEVNGENTVDNLNSMVIGKIINGKLYYELRYYYKYSTIFSYSKLMYIDLTSEKKEPVELLSWKKDYDMRLINYKITDDYVYFNTWRNLHFYKYNIKTKEFIEINQSDYDLINEQHVIKYEALNQEKFYIAGKELLLDHEKFELIYNNELIHKSNSDVEFISLFYSLRDEIIIQEQSDCNKVTGCNISKFYKFNLDSKMLEEIENPKNQICTKIILYK